jgi:hypothetical protein
MLWMSPRSVCRSNGHIIPWLRAHHLEASRVVNVFLFPRLRLLAAQVVELHADDAAYRWTLRRLRLPPPYDWTENALQEQLIGRKEDSMCTRLLQKVACFFGRHDQIVTRRKLIDKDFGAFYCAVDELNRHRNAHVQAERGDIWCCWKVCRSCRREL